MHIVPESPRWLVSKGQDEKALKILCKLHHDPADVEDQFAHRELRFIKSQLEVDLTLITEHGQWQLFTMPTYRRRSILGFVLMMGGQNIGVLVINNYNTLLYESLGLSNMQALVVGAAYNTWAAFANIGGATVSDRLGRRKALCKSLLSLVRNKISDNLTCSNWLCWLCSDVHHRHRSHCQV